MKTQQQSTALNTSRRKLLVGSAATAAAAGLGLGSSPLMAQAMEAKPNAAKQTVNVGGFEVSTLLAGTRTAPDPQTIFGMNVTPEEFQTVSAENFIPADKNQFFFTPTVVRTGDEVVLFDTGLNAAGITAPLAEAGVSPDEVSVVVITHMHGDHIGGLTDDDGNATFANARYVTGQKEFDAWAKIGVRLV